jgi:hypothetical protein
MAGMATAYLRAHRRRPIRAQAGGGELAVAYLVIALAVALIGPGAYALDARFGTALPAAGAVIVGALACLGVIVATAWPRPERGEAERRRAA